MKQLLPLILALGLTGCVDIPMPGFLKKEEKPTATTGKNIQETRSEAQTAQEEYQELQETRTAQ
jgi:starvation-inducible outer membrane lipoprotein